MLSFDDWNKFDAMATRAVSHIPHVGGSDERGDPIKPTGNIQHRGPSPEAMMNHVAKTSGGYIMRDRINPETTDDGSSWKFDTIFALPPRRNTWTYRE